MTSYNQNVINVLLTAEGTYPIGRGGVSTWCDMLVRRVPGVAYQVYTVLAHPFLLDRYTVPDGVPVWRVPLWGTEDPTEHLDLPASRIYARKALTTAAVLQQELLPAFDALQQAIWRTEPDGYELGLLFHRLHRWFQEYDYLEAMKSRQVWDFYVTGLRQGRWVNLPAMPTLADTLQTMGWLYRFLTVLTAPVPRADVTHASAAAFAGLPGVLAKLERKTPYLLTEHGVYLREQYASIGRSDMSTFAKQFLMGLVRSVVRANYAHADIVAPVAAFNARWEKRYGVDERRIRVIYNGVDPTLFAPRPRPEGAPPTVVSVARIDPLKDILTLLRAAAQVAERVPGVRFVVYGAMSVPSYYQQCLTLREELGLAETFIFAGHTGDVPAAYASGDVVVLSSISEGFPYATVEAMMSGRALVATDVGGTREACAGTGLLVQPQNPQELAAAVTRLLQDSALRTSLAEEARERALAYFTIERNLQLYRAAYEGLLRPAAPVTSVPSLVARRRQLALERARALQATGHYAKAIGEYRVAIDLDPTDPATPALLLLIAQLYLDQGDTERSWLEIERAEALAASLRHHPAS